MTKARIIFDVFNIITNEYSEDHIKSIRDRYLELAGDTTFLKAREISQMEWLEKFLDEDQ